MIAAATAVMHLWASWIATHPVHFMLVWFVISLIVSIPIAKFLVLASGRYVEIDDEDDYDFD